MKHKESLKTFKLYLKSENVKLSDLSLQMGINLMLRFYKEIRCDKCSFEEDADMLLFQWGEGEFFEVDITRQLICNSGCDDEDIWQLSLTFKFIVTEELKQIESGDRWCSNLKEVDEFGLFIRGHQAFSLLQFKLAEKVNLEFSCAG